jgi:hypothetical protein
LSSAIRREIISYGLVGKVEKVGKARKAEKVGRLLKVFGVSASGFRVLCAQFLKHYIQPAHFS